MKLVIIHNLKLINSEFCTVLDDCPAKKEEHFRKVTYKLI